MVSKKINYQKNRSYYQIYQKEWDALSLTEQGGLCRVFDVIIVDHKIKLEKTKKVLKMITLKNFSKGIKKYRDTLNKIDDAVQEIDKEIKSSLSGFDNLTTVNKKNRWF